MLAGCRLMLGLAEGGAFPAAAKAVAEWFPVRERSTAMGLINGGSAVGAVIAPPAIALVLAHAHWPWVFFLSGAVGLVWTVWWLWDYYPPDEHPRLSAAERYELRDLLVTPQQQQQSSVSWWRLFSLPQVWGMVVGKGLCDAVWFTYIAWLPKYFQEMHGFSNAQMGYIIWIPYAASGVGSVVGGWCSSRLLRSGYSLNFSRKAVLGASAALMPCIALITYVPAALAIALFSIAFFAHLSFSTLVISLPADLFPRRMVGTVVGLVGFGGSMGGMLFNLVAGYVLSYYGRAAGYPLVFAVGSTLHILSFFWILLTIRDVRPVEFPEKAAWEQPVPLPVP
jgi:ACS family hexuronate transporter-like MFS transporter